MIALTILGVVCVAYGVLIFSLNSGTLFFAVWLVLGGLFLAGAWAAHAGIWANLPSAAKIAVRAVCCAALAWLVVTQAFAISGFSGAGENAEGPDGFGLDCLVVLGAQVRESGPSIVLANRLDTAAEYLATHPHTRCIVSGGQGFNEPEAEAVVMARYLEGCGIDAARISVEDESTDTSENIENSRAFFDAETESVGIVTNNFHVFRAVALARKQGYAHAAGIAAPSNPLFLPNNMLRESLGLTKDFLARNL